MSTILAEFKSNNEKFPTDTLEVYEGTDGIVLFISDSESKNGIKFWISPDDVFKLATILGSRSK